MSRVADELRTIVGDPARVRTGEPLAPYTTFRIGGPAECLVAVATRAELAGTLAAVQATGVPFHVLGKGSNLLVGDAGLPGVVVVLAGELAHLEVQGNHVLAGGGLSLPRLAVQVSRHGLGDLTFACGIPGSVGAGVAINAGAHGGEMSRVVEAAEVFWLDGRREWIPAQEIGFGYRTSRLQGLPLVIAAVALRLHPAPAEELLAVIRRNLAQRRRTQPLLQPNAGSIFRNPPGDYAGRLIEAAGCKGWREGDAQVSERHANFIVNTGAATATEVIRLMARVRDRVEQHSGVRLEPEVRIWGANPFGPAPETPLPSHPQ